MGLTSITPISSEPAPPTSIPAAPERTSTRAVAAAVAKLNDAGYAGEGREVTFSVDQSTKQMVIKVINTDTKEVITQWPSEYLLALAAEPTKDR